MLFPQTKKLHLQKPKLLTAQDAELYLLNRDNREIAQRGQHIGDGSRTVPNVSSPMVLFYRELVDYRVLILLTRTKGGAGEEVMIG